MTVHPLSWTHLPGGCDALGLPKPPPVEKDSKEKYLTRSVDAIPEESLARIAEGYVGRYPFAEGHDSSFEVEEHLWASLPSLGLTKRTRHEIARALDPEDLCLRGEPFIAMLRGLFRLQRAGGWVRGLDAEIEQHVLRNPGDWTTEYLFEQLGAYDVSERRFAKLVEGLVSPDVRPDEGSIRRTAATISAVLATTPVEFREVGEVDGYPHFRFAPRGVSAGRPKNIIFASPRKPDIRFRDAVNNDIEIVTERDSVLVYDRPIPRHGLLWRDVQSWYAELTGIADGEEAKKALYLRLKDSLPSNSPPQRALFHFFHETLGAQARDLPILLPEVWLHWDPKTVRERGAPALLRFRMDFLLLLPNGVRVVIEVDGKQHYANEKGEADTARYAAMMAADRDLRLAGYEVFRFGGSELLGEGRRDRVRTFFERLFRQYGVEPK